MIGLRLNPEPVYPPPVSIHVPEPFYLAPEYNFDPVYLSNYALAPKDDPEPEYHPEPVTNQEPKYHFNPEYFDESIYNPRPMYHFELVYQSEPVYHPNPERPLVPIHDHEPLNIYQPESE